LFLTVPEISPAENFWKISEIMKTKFKNKPENHVKSILLAYLILALHIILIAGLGLLVIFFAGIINYMLWIFLGCLSLIIFSGYYIYKRMRKEGKTLKELLSLPLFNGRGVEVSILGGLASFKITQTEHLLGVDSSSHRKISQIENNTSTQVKEISELARLYENKLITLDEFKIAKQQILKLKK